MTVRTISQRNMLQGITSEEIYLSYDRYDQSDPLPRSRVYLLVALPSDEGCEGYSVTLVATPCFARRYWGCIVHSPPPSCRLKCWLSILSMLIVNFPPLHPMINIDNHLFLQTAKCRPLMPPTKDRHKTALAF